MKGLEGLPLKYILIVLVAALIIAAVVAVVQGWTDILKVQGEKTTGAMEEGTDKKLCDLKISTGTCTGVAEFNKTGTNGWECNKTSNKQFSAC